jgi:TRAP-type uncharacterized transport system fused permease subunit
VPFFFVMNPSLVLQGEVLDFMGHAVTAVIGVMLVCGGLQGYLAGVGDMRRGGALEWPIRVALVVGGLMFAAPGGGLMPLTPIEMTLAAAALTAPALGVAWLMGRRERLA